VAETDKIPDDEWRLDEEPIRVERAPALTPVTTAIETNLSHERLTRAVYVVTAEHVAWYVLALYVVVTHLVALGARPLDSAQGAQALAAFLIAGHGRAALALSDASWVTMLQSWIFAAIGASDATSRIVVILCALLIVAIGFAMRPVLGRAGGLAFAAVIAISPSVTYFSRGGSTAIASLAFMMIAIAIAENMRRRATIVRAFALAVAIAVWLSADPIGYVTAAAIVLSLILVGAVDLVTMTYRLLRMRVWWARRRAMVIVGAIVAIALLVVLTTGFFHRPLPASFEYYLSAAFAPPSIAIHTAVRRLVPILGFYEFAIVALALVGAFAIVTGRIGDRFAVWSVVWAIASLVALATLSADRSDAILAVLVPLAIVGAYGIDWMHQSEQWNSIKYAIGAAVALTLYVQFTTNFMYPAPDTSEAPWRRHALLFWSAPTTSIQTVTECERVRGEAPAGASAFVPDDTPQVQWYLRDFTFTESAEGATVVVTIGKTENGAVAGNPDSREFGFEEWWTPNFHTLTLGRAIRYLFTQRVWNDVEMRDLEIAKAQPKKPNP
jgi:hypothetical protein